MRDARRSTAMPYAVALSCGLNPVNPGGALSLPNPSFPMMMRFAPLLLALGVLVAGTAGTAAAQTTHNVNVLSLSFSPANLTINQGDTVNWINNSGLHNVNGSTASYPGNPVGFTNGAAAPAPWTYQFTFNTAGVYDYHCDVHGAPGSGMRGTITVQATPSLIISEYVEGSSNNKALEFYNTTGSAIDLAAGEFEVRYYFNGSSTPGLTIGLTGTVAADDVYVLAQSSADPAILAVADQTAGGGWYNGDDAVVLFRGETVVDAIGEVGFDPGAEWGTGDTSTADNTLRREDDACEADADTSDAFDPAVNYTGYPLNTFDGLGNHNLDCGGSACTISFTQQTTATYSAGPRRVTFAGRVANAGATTQVRLQIDYARQGGGPSGTLSFGPQTLPMTGGSGVPFSVVQPLPPLAPGGTYNLTYRLIDVGAGNVECATQSGSVVIPAPRVGGGDSGEAWEAGAFSLAASAATAPSEVVVSPNPARGTATLRFVTEATAEVRLAVYDALGREVAVLVDGPLEAGVHEAALDAQALPAGVYVYRLAVGGQVQSGRLTLVR